MSSNGQKDTVYIDIDDEITTVIDKVHSSPHRIVALVLPKRASVFQSIVNMKLLKRTADESKKQVVLITAESGILPLAGAVGMFVAKTLQSKPEIPEAPVASRIPEPADDAPLDKEAPVGKLAGLPPDSSEDEEMEVDNTVAPAPNGGKIGKAGKSKKPKKDSKLKIPNFDSFRKRIIFGAIAAVALIVFGVLAFVVMPKATVTLTTDTSNKELDLEFIADTAATQIDQDGKIIPAKSRENRKTDTEKVAATGQKDLGTKATGSVSLRNCSASDGKVTLPAGTTVSSSNLAFVTTSAAELPASSFSGGGSCTTSPQSVGVTAANPGDQYNVASGRTFAVAGYSAVSGTNNDAMTGGTSKIVKVITQADVDSAKQKITDRNSTGAAETLKEEFEEEGYTALTETIASGNPTVSSTPNVGDEANEVTVTSTVSSTMLGVNSDDLKSYVEETAKKDMDQDKQMIIDNGLGNLTIRLQNRLSGTKVNMTTRPIVVVGPKLDDQAIKAEIAGKKRGEAQDIVRQRPGIKDVEIAYSPFWVQTTPKSTKKIKIVFEKTSDSGDSNNSEQDE